MSGPHDNTRKTIEAAAAEWVLRLDEAEATSATRAELMDWLILSPQHIDEFLLATALWRELDDIDARRAIDIEEVIAEARNNVVALARADEPGVESPTTSARRSRRPWLAGLAAVLVAAIGTLTYLSFQDPIQRYDTGVGQQTLFTLSDGSIVHLNTQSTLTVRMTETVRELELDRGEAMFEVARDPARPFRVHSGAVLIEAIGTQFNVYRRDEGTTVTVVEGTVKVEAAQAPLTSTAHPVQINSVTLEAGEEARTDAAGDVARIDAPDLEKNTAWRERRLVFREDSLVTVAGEFSRYNRQQIVIEAPDSATRRITATFDADDAESFISFLERDPELRVIRDNGTIRVQLLDGH